VTYLITGASGFLGTKLVHLLLENGHSVNYLGRKRSTHLDSRAAYHCWNPAELPPLDSVPPLDVVIHLAGEPIDQRWTSEAKHRIRDSRVRGTQELVTAIGQLQDKPRVLVTASAVGYYGDRGDEVLTENSAPGKGFLADVCIAWEHESLRAQEFGVRVAPIRTGVVLGREGGALPRMLPPFQFGVGGKLGDGRQWMPWIHVDDLLRLYLFAAETETVVSPMNGTAPQPVFNAQFTRELAQTLRRPAILPVPKFALKLAFGEMADILFDSLRVVPEAAEKAGFTFQHRELGTALRSLLQ
jgi:uncharacterized protein